MCIRDSATSIVYKGFSIRKDSEIQSIPAAGCIKFKEDKKWEVIEESCRLKEFRVEQANNKIVLPKKDFDYIVSFTVTSAISLFVYNKSSEIANLYRLKADGDFEFVTTAGS